MIRNSSVNMLSRDNQRMYKKVLHVMNCYHDFRPSLEVLNTVLEVMRRRCIENIWYVLFPGARKGQTDVYEIYNHSLNILVVLFSSSLILDNSLLQRLQSLCPPPASHGGRASACSRARTARQRPPLAASGPRASGAPSASPASAAPRKGRQQHRPSRS